MKFVRKIFALLICATLLTAANNNVATSVAHFLKIGIGGRAEAMGGAFTAQADDASSLYWNPAGLAVMSSPQVMFSQTNWITDINHVFLGIAWPVSPRFGSLGLSLISLSMEDLEETTEKQPEGTGRKFPAGDFQFGVAYARKISDRFSVGLHMKLIQEVISFSRARAMAVDVGTRYTTDFLGLKIGMAISNFGTEMTMGGTDLIYKKTDPYPDIGSNPNVNSLLEPKSWPLPTSIRIGMSLQPVGPSGMLNPGTATLTINADYFDPRDFNPYLNLGAEAVIFNVLALRAGLVNRFSANFEYDDAEGISNIAISSSLLGDYEQLMTFGFGLEQKLPFSNTVVTVDYSYSNIPFFSGVQRFTLSLKF